MYNELRQNNEQEWDFHKVPLRNKIQLELMSELEIPDREKLDWMSKNASFLGEIMDDDSDFYAKVLEKDWEGAKKVLVQKMEEHSSVV